MVGSFLKSSNPTRPRSDFPTIRFPESFAAFHLKSRSSETSGTKTASTIYTEGKAETASCYLVVWWHIA
jgi:hypothetical protein